MSRPERAIFRGILRSGQSRTRAARRTLAVAIALAGVIAVMTIGFAMISFGRGGQGAAAPRSGPDRPARPLPSATAAGTRTHSAAAKTPEAGPRLVIPAIKVDAPMVPTGTTGAQGTAALSIPGDIDTVGLWDGAIQEGSRTLHEYAPRPGQPGVTVIAGHVDSVAGPGALYYLRDLQVGDSIEITDASGHVSTWLVDAPPQISLKTELPSALWVTTGPPTVALVTCGGPFDAATGHYLDNVIVWARQASNW